MGQGPPADAFAAEEAQLAHGRVVALLVVAAVLEPEDAPHRGRGHDRLQVPRRAVENQRVRALKLEIGVHLFPEHQQGLQLVGEHGDGQGEFQPHGLLVQDVDEHLALVDHRLVRARGEPVFDPAKAQFLIAVAHHLGGQCGQVRGQARLVLSERLVEELIELCPQVLVHRVLLPAGLGPCACAGSEPGPGLGQLLA